MAAQPSQLLQQLENLSHVYAQMFYSNPTVISCRAWRRSLRRLKQVDGRKALSVLRSNDVTAAHAGLLPGLTKGQVAAGAPSPGVWLLPSSSESSWHSQEMSSTWKKEAPG